MSSPLRFVPAQEPEATSQTKINVLAIFAAILLLSAVILIVNHVTSIGRYQRAITEQIAIFDGVTVVMRQADEGAVFATAAEQVDTVDAVVSELASLTPPRGAKEFHRLLVETTSTYAEALHMIADADDNPLLAIALAASIREKLDTYHSSADRLDIKRLRVRY